MDRQFVKENDLVERYLRDQLALEQAEAFEQFYLTCPQTMEDLELARALRCGIKEAGDLSALPARATTGFGWLKNLVRPTHGASGPTRPALVPAMALLLVAVAAVPLLFAALVKQDQGLVQIAQATRLNLPLLRSSAGAFQPVAQTGAPAAGSLMLVLELGYSDYEFHQVQIVDYPAGRVLAEEAGLTLVGEGDLELLIDTLPAGRYIAVVQGSEQASLTEEVGRFPFQLN